ncbi:hypothetical protein Bbelb_237210 [Branchiostoma belcheri]|nr:hypothetical protein Bbelb_237210 [Branchiostoma belcheri]
MIRDTSSPFQQIKYKVVKKEGTDSPRSEESSGGSAQVSVSSTKVTTTTRKTVQQGAGPPATVQTELVGLEEVDEVKKLVKSYLEKIEQLEDENASLRDTVGAAMAAGGGGGGGGRITSHSHALQCPHCGISTEEHGSVLQTLTETGIRSEEVVDTVTKEGQTVKIFRSSTQTTSVDSETSHTAQHKDSTTDDGTVVSVEVGHEILLQKVQSLEDENRLLKNRLESLGGPKTDPDSEEGEDSFVMIAMGQEALGEVDIHTLQNYSKEELLTTVTHLITENKTLKVKVEEVQILSPSKVHYGDIIRGQTQELHETEGNRRALEQLEPEARLALFQDSNAPLTIQVAKRNTLQSQLDDARQSNIENNLVQGNSFTHAQYKQQVVDLQIQLDRLKEENSALAAQVEHSADAESETRKIQEEVAYLRSEIERLTTEKDNYAQQVERSREVIALGGDGALRELTEGISSLQAQLKDKTDELEDTEKVLASIRLELDAARQQKYKFEDEKTRLKGEASKSSGMRQEIETLKAQLEVSKKSEIMLVETLEQVEALQKDNARLETEREALNLKVDETARDFMKVQLLEQQVEKLNVDLKKQEETEKELQEVKESLDAARHEREGLLADQAAYNRHKEEVREAKEKIQVLQETLALLAKQVKDADTMERDLETALKEARENLKAVTSEKATLLQEAESRTKELEAQQGKIETLKGQVEDADSRTKELEAAQEKIQILQGQVQDAESRTKELESAQEEIQTLQGQVQDAESRTKELEAAQQKIQTLQGQIEDAESRAKELEAAQEKIQTLQGQIEDAESRAKELEAAQEKIQTLQGKIEDAESRAKEFEAAQEKMQALQGQVQDAESQTKELEAAQEQIQKLQLKVQDAESRTKELEAAQEKIKALQEQVEDAGSRTKDLEAAQEKIQMLQRQIGDAESRAKELEAAQEKITALQQQVQDAESRTKELKAAQKKIKALQAQVEDTTSRTKDLEAAQEKIQTMQEKVKDAEGHTKELEAAQQKIQTLQGQVQDLNAKSTAFTTTTQQFEFTKKELDILQVKNAELETQVAEISDLKKEITVARAVIQQLREGDEQAESKHKEESAKLEKDLKISMENMDTLKTEKDALEAKYTTSAKELEEARLHIKTLQAEKETLLTAEQKQKAKDLQEAQGRLEVLSEENKRLLKEQDKLQKQNEDLNVARKQIQSLQEKFTIQAELFDKIQGDLTKKVDLVEDLQMENQKLQKQNENLGAEKEKKHTERVITLETQIVELTSRLEKAEEVKRDLQATGKELANIRTEKEQLIQEREVYQVQLAKKEEEVANTSLLETEVTTLKEKIQDLKRSEQELTEMQKKFAAINQECEDRDRALEELRKEKEVFCNQLNEMEGLKKEIAIARNVIKELREGEEKTSEHEQKSKELTNVLEKTRMEVNVLQEEKEEMSRCFAASQKQLEGARRQIEQLEDEKQSLTNTSEDATELKAQLEEAKTSLTTELQNFFTVQSELQGALERIRTLEEEKKLLEEEAKEVTILERELSVAREESHQLRVEKSSTTEKVEAKDIQTDSGVARRRADRLKREREVHVEQRRQSEKLVKDLEAAKEEIQRLKEERDNDDENNQTSVSSTSISTSVVITTGEFEGIETELSKAMERIQALEEERRHLKDEIRMAHHQETDFSGDSQKQESNKSVSTGKSDTGVTLTGTRADRSRENKQLAQVTHGQEKQVEQPEKEQRAQKGDMKSPQEEDRSKRTNGEASVSPGIAPTILITTEVNDIQTEVQELKERIQLLEKEKMQLKAEIRTQKTGILTGGEKTQWQGPDSSTSESVEAKEIQTDPGVARKHAQRHGSDSKLSETVGAKEIQTDPGVARKRAAKLRREKGTEGQRIRSEKTKSKVSKKERRSSKESEDDDDGGSSDDGNIERFVSTKPLSSEESLQHGTPERVDAKEIQTDPGVARKRAAKLRREKEAPGQRIRSEETGNSKESKLAKKEGLSSTEEEEDDDASDEAVRIERSVSPSEKSSNAKDIQTEPGVARRRAGKLKKDKETVKSLKAELQAARKEIDRLNELQVKMAADLQEVNELRLQHDEMRGKSEKQAATLTEKREVTREKAVQSVEDTGSVETRTQTKTMTLLNRDDRMEESDRPQLTKTAGNARAQPSSSSSEAEASGLAPNVLARYELLVVNETYLSTLSDAEKVTVLMEQLHSASVAMKQLEEEKEQLSMEATNVVALQQQLYMVQSEVDQMRRDKEGIIESTGVEVGIEAGHGSIREEEEDLNDELEKVKSRLLQYETLDHQLAEARDTVDTLLSVKTSLEERATLLENQAKGNEDMLRELAKQNAEMRDELMSVEFLKREVRELLFGDTSPSVGNLSPMLSPSSRKLLEAGGGSTRFEFGPGTGYRGSGMRQRVDRASDTDDVQGASSQGASTDNYTTAEDSARSTSDSDRDLTGRTPTQTSGTRKSKTNEILTTIVSTENVIVESDDSQDSIEVLRVSGVGSDDRKEATGSSSETTSSTVVKTTRLGEKPDTTDGEITPTTGAHFASRKRLTYQEEGKGMSTTEESKQRRQIMGSKGREGGQDGSSVSQGPDGISEMQTGADHHDAESTEDVQVNDARREQTSASGGQHANRIEGVQAASDRQGTGITQEDISSSHEKVTEQASTSSTAIIPEKEGKVNKGVQEDSIGDQGQDMPVSETSDGPSASNNADTIRDTKGAKKGTSEKSGVSWFQQNVGSLFGSTPSTKQKADDSQGGKDDAKDTGSFEHGEKVKTDPSTTTSTNDNDRSSLLSQADNTPDQDTTSSKPSQGVSETDVDTMIKQQLGVAAVTEETKQVIKNTQSIKLLLENLQKIQIRIWQSLSKGDNPDSDADSAIMEMTEEMKENLEEMTTVLAVLRTSVAHESNNDEEGETEDQDFSKAQKENLMTNLQQLSASSEEIKVIQEEVANLCSSNSDDSSKSSKIRSIVERLQIKLSTAVTAVTTMQQTEVLILKDNEQADDEEQPEYHKIPQDDETSTRGFFDGIRDWWRGSSDKTSSLTKEIPPGDPNSSTLFLGGTSPMQNVSVREPSLEDILAPEDKVVRYKTGTDSSIDTRGTSTTDGHVVSSSGPSQVELGTISEQQTTDATRSDLKEAPRVTPAGRLQNIQTIRVLIEELYRIRTDMADNYNRGRNRGSENVDAPDIDLQTTGEKMREKLEEVTTVLAVLQTSLDVEEDEQTEFTTGSSVKIGETKEVYGKLQEVSVCVEELKKMQSDIESSYKQLGTEDSSSDEHITIEADITRDLESMGVKVDEALKSVTRIEEELADLKDDKTKSPPGEGKSWSILGGLSSWWQGGPGKDSSMPNISVPEDAGDNVDISGTERDETIEDETVPDLSDEAKETIANMQIMWIYMEDMQNIYRDILEVKNEDAPGETDSSTSRKIQEKTVEMDRKLDSMTSLRKIERMGNRLCRMAKMVRKMEAQAISQLAAKTDSGFFSRLFATEHAPGTQQISDDADDIQETTSEETTDIDDQGEEDTIDTSAPTESVVSAEATAFIANIQIITSHIRKMETICKDTIDDYSYQESEEKTVDKVEEGMTAIKEKVDGTLSLLADIQTGIPTEPAEGNQQDSNKKEQEKSITRTSTVLKEVHELCCETIDFVKVPSLDDGQDEDVAATQEMVQQNMRKIQTKLGTLPEILARSETVASEEQASSANSIDIGDLSQLETTLPAGKDNQVSTAEDLTINVQKAITHITELDELQKTIGELYTERFRDDIDDVRSEEVDQVLQREMNNMGSQIQVIWNLVPNRPNVAQLMEATAANGDGTSPLGLTDAGWEKLSQVNGTLLELKARQDTLLKVYQKRVREGERGELGAPSCIVLDAQMEKEMAGVEANTGSAIQQLSEVLEELNVAQHDDTADSSPKAEVQHPGIISRLLWWRRKDKDDEDDTVMPEETMILIANMQILWVYVTEIKQTQTCLQDVYSDRFGDGITEEHCKEVDKAIQEQKENLDAKVERALSVVQEIQESLVEQGNGKDEAQQVRANNKLQEVASLIQEVRNKNIQVSEMCKKQATEEEGDGKDEDSKAFIDARMQQELQTMSRKLTQTERLVTAAEGLALGHKLADKTDSTDDGIIDSALDGESDEEKTQSTGPLRRLFRWYSSGYNPDHVMFPEKDELENSPDVPAEDEQTKPETTTEGQTLPDETDSGEGETHDTATNIATTEAKKEESQSWFGGWWSSQATSTLSTQSPVEAPREVKEEDDINRSARDQDRADENAPQSTGPFRRLLRWYSSGYKPDQVTFPEKEELEDLTTSHPEVDATGEESIADTIKGSTKAAMSAVLGLKEVCAKYQGQAMATTEEKGPEQKEVELDDEGMQQNITVIGQKITDLTEYVNEMRLVTQYDISKDQEDTELTSDEQTNIGIDEESQKFIVTFDKLLVQMEELTSCKTELQTLSSAEKPVEEEHQEPTTRFLQVMTELHTKICDVGETLAEIKPKALAHCESIKTAKQSIVETVATTPQEESGGVLSRLFGWGQDSAFWRRREEVEGDDPAMPKERMILIANMQSLWVDITEMKEIQTHLQDAYSDRFGDGITEEQCEEVDKAIQVHKEGINAKVESVLSVVQEIQEIFNLEEDACTNAAQQEQANSKLQKVASLIQEVKDTNIQISEMYQKQVDGKEEDSKEGSTTALTDAKMQQELQNVSVKLIQVERLVTAAEGLALGYKLTDLTDDETTDGTTDISTSEAKQVEVKPSWFRGWWSSQVTTVADETDDETPDGATDVSTSEAKAKEEEVKPNWFSGWWRSQVTTERSTQASVDEPSEVENNSDIYGKADNEDQEGENDSQSTGPGPFRRLFRWYSSGYNPDHVTFPDVDKLVNLAPHSSDDENDMQTTTDAIKNSAKAATSVVMDLRKMCAGFQGETIAPTEDGGPGQTEEVSLDDESLQQNMTAIGQKISVLTEQVNEMKKTVVMQYEIMSKHAETGQLMDSEQMDMNNTDFEEKRQDIVDDFDKLLVQIQEIKSCEMKLLSLTSGSAETSTTEEHHEQATKMSELVTELDVALSTVGQMLTDIEPKVLEHCESVKTAKACVTEETEAAVPQEEGRGFLSRLFGWVQRDTEDPPEQLLAEISDTSEETADVDEREKDPVSDVQRALVCCQEINEAQEKVLDNYQERFREGTSEVRTQETGQIIRRELGTIESKTTELAGLLYMKTTVATDTMAEQGSGSTSDQDKLLLEVLTYCEEMRETQVKVTELYDRRLRESTVADDGSEACVYLGTRISKELGSIESNATKITEKLSSFLQELTGREDAKTEVEMSQESEETPGIFGRLLWWRQTVDEDKKPAETNIPNETGTLIANMQMIWAYLEEMKQTQTCFEDAYSDRLGDGITKEQIQGVEKVIRTQMEHMEKTNEKVVVLLEEIQQTMEDGDTEDVGMEQQEDVKLHLQDVGSIMTECKELRRHVDELYHLRLSSDTEANQDGATDTLAISVDVQLRQEMNNMAKKLDKAGQLLLMAEALTQGCKVQEPKDTNIGESEKSPADVQTTRNSSWWWTSDTTDAKENRAQSTEIPSLLQEHVERQHATLSEGKEKTGMVRRLFRWWSRGYDPDHVTFPGREELSEIESTFSEKDDGQGVTQEDLDTPDAQSTTQDPGSSAGKTADKDDVVEDLPAKTDHQEVEPEPSEHRGLLGRLFQWWRTGQQLALPDESEQVDASLTREVESNIEVIKIYLFELRNICGCLQERFTTEVASMEGGSGEDTEDRDKIDEATQQLIANRLEEIAALVNDIGTVIPAEEPLGAEGSKSVTVWEDLEKIRVNLEDTNAIFSEIQRMQEQSGTSTSGQVAKELQNMEAKLKTLADTVINIEPEVLKYCEEPSTADQEEGKHEGAQSAGVLTRMFKHWWETNYNPAQSASSDGTEEEEAEGIEEDTRERIKAAASDQMRAFLTNLEITWVHILELKRIQIDMEDSHKLQGQAAEDVSQSCSNVQQELAKMGEKLVMVHQLITDLQNSVPEEMLAAEMTAGESKSLHAKVSEQLKRISFIVDTLQTDQFNVTNKYSVSSYVEDDSSIEQFDTMFNEEMEGIRLKLEEVTELFTDVEDIVLKEMKRKHWKREAESDKSKKVTETTEKEPIQEQRESLSFFSRLFYWRTGSERRETEPESDEQSSTESTGVGETTKETKSKVTTKKPGLVQRLSDWFTGRPSSQETSVEMPAAGKSSTAQPSEGLSTQVTRENEDRQTGLFSTIVEWWSYRTKTVSVKDKDEAPTMPLGLQDFIASVQLADVYCTQTQSALAELVDIYHQVPTEELGDKKREEDIKNKLQVIENNWKILLSTTAKLESALAKDGEAQEDGSKITEEWIKDDATREQALRLSHDLKEMIQATLQTFPWIEAKPVGEELEEREQGETTDITIQAMQEMHSSLDNVRIKLQAVERCTLLGRALQEELPQRSEVNAQQDIATEETDGQDKDAKSSVFGRVQRWWSGVYEPNYDQYNYDQYRDSMEETDTDSPSVQPHMSREDLNAAMMESSTEEDFEPTNESAGILLQDAEDESIMTKGLRLELDKQLDRLNERSEDQGIREGVFGLLVVASIWFVGGVMYVNTNHIL